MAVDIRGGGGEGFGAIDNTRKNLAYLLGPILYTLIAP